MITTLGKIWEFNPCCKYREDGGWGLLTKNLETADHSKEVSLMDILKSNGIKDAVWALRCFDYLDYCLFLADVGESVLSIYEKNNSNNAPRLAIQAIRDYKAGGITKEKLIAAAANAYDADTYDTYAAYAAYATADDANAYDAYHAVTYAYVVYADVQKWEKEITALFVKRFGEK